MSDTTKNDFELVARPHGNCWQHKSMGCWIVFYENLKVAGKPCYVTYQAIESFLGRDPWAVNNRRTGAYNSLDVAMQSV